MGLRICWFSNCSWAASGYGVQARYLLPLLQQKGHEIFQLAFWGLEGGVMRSNGMVIYPKGNDPYGNDVLQPTAMHSGADIVISLIDAWVLKDFPNKAPSGRWLAWCVTEETPVTMADGTQKRITEVQVGDVVQGADKGHPKHAVVKATQKIPARETGELLSITTETGRHLNITADNLVWASKPAGFMPRWLPAGCITPGDMVYCSYSRLQARGGKGDGWKTLDNRGRRLLEIQCRQDDVLGNEQGVRTVAEVCREAVAIVGDAKSTTRPVDGRGNSVFKRERATPDGIPDGRTSQAVALCDSEAGPSARARLCESQDREVDESREPAFLDALPDRLFGGDSGWRGNDKHPHGASEKEAHSLSAYSLHIGNGCHSSGCLEQDAGHRLQQAKPPHADTVGAETPVAGGVDRFSCLPNSEHPASLLDRQGTAGASGNAVHSQPGGYGRLQPAIHARTGATLSTSPRFEQERVTAVERIAAPTFVYDLTTTTDNFVAGGFLIHNCPVDSEPVPPPVVEAVRGAYYVLPYSRHGEAEFKRVGVTNRYGESNVRFIPHGQDCRVYHPAASEDERRAAKRALGFPEDCFLAGMVAANKGFPPRKCFDRQFEGFARFRQRHPEAYLYCHADPTTVYGGMDLQREAQSYGLPPGAVRFPDRYLNWLGFPDTWMARAYRAFDVLLAATGGEGWAIPITEAMATGVLPVVTDFTAMREHIEHLHTGYKVRVQATWKTPLDSYQALPDIQDIAEGLEWAYQQPRGPHFPCIEYARQYEWSTIVDRYWQPLLQEIEGRIDPSTRMQKAAIDEIRDWLVDSTYSDYRERTAP